MFSPLCNNWMIVIGDGKARGQRMMTDKITELDQQKFEMFMKKTKVNNVGWITLGKKM